MELLLKLLAVLILGYAAHLLIVNTTSGRRRGFVRRTLTFSDSFTTEVSLTDGIVIVLTAAFALYYAVTDDSLMWGAFATGLLLGPVIYLIRRFSGRA